MINVAAAVIVNKDGKILVTQRSKNDNLSLKWEFPGGKIEDGETAEECLKREIMEELNLEIEVLGYLGSCVYKYDTGEICLIAYKVGTLSEDLRLNVHNDAKWIRTDELRCYDFAPADIELLNVIQLP
jgi:8-oxo-dGTP diphosphatase